MSTFNYNDWLPEEHGKPKKDTTSPLPHNLSKGDLELVERAVKAVEESGRDITADYATWRDLGFALAQLQEGGREFFHRISRFHPYYDRKECDEQFDRCLKSNGSGITLGTFFHHVKAAGVEAKDLSSRGGRGGYAEDAGKDLGSAGVDLGSRGGRGGYAEDAGKDSGSAGGDLGSRGGCGGYAEDAGKDLGSAGVDLGSRGGRGGYAEDAGKDLGSAGVDLGSRGGRGGYAEDAEKDSARDLTGFENLLGLSSESSNRTAGDEEEEEEVELPVFPEGVYGQLPEFLKRVVAPGSTSEEKDLLLLGSLAALSAALPGFYGIYDGMLLRPNLYLFVTAPASAGKGRLSLVKNLLLPINKELRGESKLLRTQYEGELAEYNAAKGEKGERPVKPPEKMLLIPANNSATGFFQLLYDNGGRGLLLENEGDTVSNAVRAEYGNYSDGLRKAWQHEGISYYRRTDREYVDIESPCISAVLSGTPRQVATLIPSAENGLFSRFLFYYMNLKPVWKDVFSGDGENLEEHYLQLGEEFFSFYKTLKEEQRVKLVFSRKQKLVFHSYFNRSQQKYLSLKPKDYTATVRRMGVSCFRIAMVLTALRGWEEGNESRHRQCDDRDFNTALQLAAVLLRHSSLVYASLPLEKKPRTGNTRSERFLEGLPQHFNRQEYLQLAETLRIPAKTADRYIYKFIENELIEREQHGSYLNHQFGNKIELA